MIRKEMIAMLLAGGQGSRLGVLTADVAKPAVAFGGKYRIIDFPLSNCINSGIDTVGVLTQYQPLRLNTHIGIGIPWDLDRNVGGVTVLPPYEKSSNSEWYTGTANAIYQNLEYMEQYNPDYVLILSGDHIYIFIIQKIGKNFTDNPGFFGVNHKPSVCHFIAKGRNADDTATLGFFGHSSPYLTRKPNRIVFVRPFNNAFNQLAERTVINGFGHTDDFNTVFSQQRFIENAFLLIAGES